MILALRKSSKILLLLLLRSEKKSDTNKNQCGIEIIMKFAPAKRKKLYFSLFFSLLCSFRFCFIFCCFCTRKWKTGFEVEPITSTDTLSFSLLGIFFLFLFFYYQKIIRSSNFIRFYFNILERSRKIISKYTNKTKKELYGIKRSNKNEGRKLNSRKISQEEYYGIVLLGKLLSSVFWFWVRQSARTFNWRQIA